MVISDSYLHRLFFWTSEFPICQITTFVSFSIVFCRYFVRILHIWYWIWYIFSGRERSRTRVHTEWPVRSHDPRGFPSWWVETLLIFKFISCMYFSENDLSVMKTPVSAAVLAKLSHTWLFSVRFKGIVRNIEATALLRLLCVLGLFVCLLIDL